MKVFVTPYGLRPFRIEEITDQMQYKGSYKLPKNITKSGGGKWVKLDYYFTKEQIYNNVSNKKLLKSLYKIGMELTNYNHQWSNELRQDFEKLEKHIKNQENLEVQCELSEADKAYFEFRRKPEHPLITEIKNYGFLWK